jgi:hypothetical protein
VQYGAGVNGFDFAHMGLAVAAHADQTGDAMTGGDVDGGL